MDNVKPAKTKQEKSSVLSIRLPESVQDYIYLNDLYLTHKTHGYKKTYIKFVGGGV